MDLEEKEIIIIKLYIETLVTVLLHGTVTQ